MDLGYQQHGYGLSWTPDIVLGLTVDDAESYRAILEERLKAAKETIEGK